MKQRMLHALTKYPFAIGLAIRLLVAFLLPLLLDDGRIIPGVAYTDVDYHIFEDAANYIRNGESPYQRHTYRYTPFLALILTKVNGRYLFCFADALCGKLILHLQKKASSDSSRGFAPVPKPTTLTSCFMWMYNPLVINISTRGSAESLIVLLPVLLTVAVAQSHFPLKNVMAGFLHGIAVHAKVYPIIYTISYMAFLSNSCSDKLCIHSVSTFLSTWVRRLLRPAPVLFGITFLCTWVGLTYLAVILYGNDALEQGLLYHLNRLDHRHNYSMWWYPIYLARRQLSGSILILPQIILLLMSSLAQTDQLGWTLFFQTYMFVTFNKVITAQYFTWYLCLLPLCHFQYTSKLRNAGGLVITSMITWLIFAYFLEMQGLAVHRLVWIASVLYFIANLNMLRVLMESSDLSRLTKSEKAQ